MIPNENRRVAVFTVRQVVKEGKPILLVVHSQDGEWQFLTNEEVVEDDIMIVALENIIKIDATLEDVLWMPEGMSATRVGVGSEWVTSIYEE